LSMFLAMYSTINSSLENTGSIRRVEEGRHIRREKITHFKTEKPYSRSDYYISNNDKG
jgi:hypothetical protein